MVWFSKNELRKLSAVCEARKAEMEAIRDSDDGEAIYLERCLAHREAEWMQHLSKKLLSVAESDAKRVEITY